MTTLTHLVTPDLPLSCRSKSEFENTCLPRITIIRDICRDRSSSAEQLAQPQSDSVTIGVFFPCSVLHGNKQSIKCQEGSWEGEGLSRQHRSQYTFLVSDTHKISVHSLHLFPQVIQSEPQTGMFSMGQGMATTGYFLYMSQSTW